MKFLEKLSLILFSLIICIISIVLILLSFNIINIEYLTRIVLNLLEYEQTTKITIISCVVALLLSLKCLFFRSKQPDDGRNGITLENSSGKLIISKESLETLIANVVKEVPGIEAIGSRTVLDDNNNVAVYVVTLVSKEILIKDVSIEIQTRIKETLKRTADLEVKQVNVKVKNITNKKVKELMPGKKVEENNSEKIEENVEVNEE